MDQNAYSQIAISREGRILTLTLNRPAALNAVNRAMHEELARVFRDADQDPDSDVVILTGAGPSFCAGGDIGWMQEGLTSSNGPTLAEGKRIVLDLLDMEKPVIAKVRGNCIGLGCTIALFCDIIIAAEDARFADPHVRVGLVAGDGGAVIWPQLVGYAKAKEYLFTGDIIEAAKAERMGLINHVVPAAELDAQVAAMAAKLARGAGRAIRYTKIAVNLGLKQVANAVFDASLAYEGMSMKTDDHREAVTAFIEKRRPNFSGH